MCDVLQWKVLCFPISDEKSKLTYIWTLISKQVMKKLEINQKQNESLKKKWFNLHKMEVLETKYCCIFVIIETKISLYQFDLIPVKDSER